MASGLAIDRLHFGYDVRAIHSRKPSWQPIRVFDDGLKTYIQFPTNMAATEAPPLFLIGADKQVQLVNYRYLNGYYIVDRLIERYSAKGEVVYDPFCGLGTVPVRAICSFTSFTSSAPTS